MSRRNRQNAAGAGSSNAVANVAGPSNDNNDPVPSPSIHDDLLADESEIESEFETEVFWRTLGSGHIPFEEHLLELHPERIVIWAIQELIHPAYVYLTFLMNQRRQLQVPLTMKIWLHVLTNMIEDEENHHPMIYQNQDRIIQRQPLLRKGLAALYYEGIETDAWNTGARTFVSMFAQLHEWVVSVDSRAFSYYEWLNITEREIDGSTMSFPVTMLKELIDWYKTYRPLSTPAKAGDYFVVSGIPRQLTPICICSTYADTTGTIADARGTNQQSMEVTLEELDTDESDGEELDLDQFTQKISTRNTGPSGCNISLLKNGARYTLKSPKFRVWKSYIDVKIYGDMRALKREKDPMKHWQQADLRAKICLGNPMHPNLWRRTKAALKELRAVIVENAKLMPAVQCERQ